MKISRASSDPKNTQAQNKCRADLNMPTSKADTAAFLGVLPDTSLGFALSRSRSRSPNRIASPPPTQKDPSEPVNDETSPYDHMLEKHIGVVMASLKKYEVDIPSSWNFDNMDQKSMAAKLAGISSKCVRMMENGVGGQLPAEEAQPIEADQLPADLQKVKTCVETEGGNFNMHGPLGAMWSRAKSQPDVAQAYAEVIGRDKQRAFRAEWLKKKYMAKVTTRTQTQGYEQTDFSNGVYRPIQVIFTKEGGDSDAAEATRNLVLMCTALGGKWISFNKFTRRLAEKCVGDAQRTDRNRRR